MSIQDKSVLPLSTELPLPPPPPPGQRSVVSDRLDLREHWALGRSSSNVRSAWAVMTRWTCSLQHSDAGLVTTMELSRIYTNQGHHHDKTKHSFLARYEKAVMNASVILSETRIHHLWLVPSRRIASTDLSHIASRTDSSHSWGVHRYCCSRYGYNPD
jgi:hypothetical protein